MQNDLQFCVSSAQSQTTPGGAYYVPRYLNNTAGGPGQCVPKTTSLSGSSWVLNHDPAPASTVLFGSCCDYQGIVPSAVQASCCQTRTCNPTSYPTCNSTYASPSVNYANVSLLNKVEADHF